MALPHEEALLLFAALDMEAEDMKAGGKEPPSPPRTGTAGFFSLIAELKAKNAGGAA